MPALLQIARLYQIQVCILYLIVYNLIIKCAKNCTSQDHSRHIIVRYHTHTPQKTRPANQRSQRDSQIAILFQLITFTWTLINQLAKYCTHNLLVWRNSTNTWFWRMQRIFLLFLDIFDLLNPKSEWCKCVHVERSEIWVKKCRFWSKNMFLACFKLLHLFLFRRVLIITF